MMNCEINNAKCFINIYKWSKTIVNRIVENVFSDSIKNFFMNFIVVRKMNYFKSIIFRFRWFISTRWFSMLTLTRKAIELFSINFKLIFRSFNIIITCSKSQKLNTKINCMKNVRNIVWRRKILIRSDVNFRKRREI